MDSAAAQTADQTPPPDSSAVETITVSATKRLTNSQDIPSSVQALTSDSLNQFNAENFNDVIGKISGVNGNSTADGRTSFNIRGIQSVNTSILDSPTVGYYLDETPLSASAINPDINLFDVDRVEVLKGPQGTLYGEGSLSGTIRIITKQPNLTDFEGQTFSSVGGIDGGGLDSQVSTAVSVPLIENKLAIRATATYRGLGGWVDNTYLPKKDQNENENKNLRLAIRAEPTEHTDLTFSYTHQSQNSSGNDEEVLGAPIPGTSQDHFNGYSFDKIDIFNLNGTENLGFGQLVSSTSFVSRRRSGTSDDTEYHTFVSLLPSFLGYDPIQEKNGVELTIPIRERVFTQEIRLVSDDSGPFQYVVGGWYKYRNLRYDVTEDAPDLYPYIGDTTRTFHSSDPQTYHEIANFGEATYEVIPDLSVTGGYRLFRQTITGSDDTTYNADVAPLLGQPATQHFFSHQGTTDHLFKAAVQYQFTPDIMSYFLYSEGVRGGGINTKTMDPAETPHSYAPDFTKNYEIGSKTEWLDHRLLLNASIYHIDWQNIQTQVISSSGNSAFTVNGGQAEVDGAELELITKPMKGLDIGGNVTLLYARTAEAFNLNGAIAPAGTELPLSSHFKSNLYTHYETPITDAINLTSRIDWDHTGSRLDSLQTSAHEAYKFGAYDTISLRGGITVRNVTADLFVNNLFDQRAYTSYSDTSDVITGAPFRTVTTIRPRTIGLELRVTY